MRSSRRLRVALLLGAFLGALPAPAQTLEVDPTRVWVGSHDGFYIFNKLNIVFEEHRYGILYSQYEDAVDETGVIHSMLAKAASERKKVRVDLTMLAEIQQIKQRETDRTMGSVASRNLPGVFLSKMHGAAKPSEAFEIVETGE